MADRASSYWRSLDWRVWRHSYIAETPESERVAWISPVGHQGQPATVNEVGAEQRVPALVKDVSLGGIILELGRKFDSGTLLRVEVAGSAESPALDLLVRVIHVTDRANGNWNLSCCFARELSEEDLQAFGAQRVRPEENDGRAWVRFPCEGETVFHSVLAAKHEKWKAKILNISAGGVGLLVTRQFEVGTLLRLELLGGGGRPVNSVLARVAHATERPDGGWLLGCTFVSQLENDSPPLVQ